MEIKVGDIYIRHLDGKIYRVKWIDHRTVVLENGNHLRLAKIFDLENGTAKENPNPFKKLLQDCRRKFLSP